MSVLGRMFPPNVKPLYIACYGLCLIQGGKPLLVQAYIVMARMMSMFSTLSFLLVIFLVVIYCCGA